MWLVYIPVLLAGFSLASLLALWSYGWFAERVRGGPSIPLPVSDDGTRLDRMVAPLVTERPGQSGLMLLDGNLDAFAARALNARRAGRSLDLQYYIWNRDLTGRLLVSEIVQAADRGIRVRLLLDDINAQGHDPRSISLNAEMGVVFEHGGLKCARSSPTRHARRRAIAFASMTERSSGETRRPNRSGPCVQSRKQVSGGG